MVTDRITELRLTSITFYRDVTLPLAPLAGCSISIRFA